MAVHTQATEEVGKNLVLHRHTGRMFDLRFRREIQLPREPHQLHVRQRQALHLRVKIGRKIGVETKTRHQVLHVPMFHRAVTIGGGFEALFEHTGKGLLRVEAQFV
ncbi:hypothetical protein D3C81_1965750 [compost metagenome]